MPDCPFKVPVPAQPRLKTSPSRLLPVMHLHDVGLVAIADGLHHHALAAALQDLTASGKIWSY